MKIKLIFLLSLFSININHTILTMDDSDQNKFILTEDLLIDDPRMGDDSNDLTIDDNSDQNIDNSNVRINDPDQKIDKSNDGVDESDRIKFLRNCYYADFGDIDVFIEKYKNIEDKDVFSTGLKKAFESFDLGIIHSLHLQKVIEQLLDTIAYPNTIDHNNEISLEELELEKNVLTLVEYVCTLIKEEKILAEYGRPILHHFFKKGFEFKIDDVKPGDTIVHRIVKACTIPKYDHDILSILLNTALECGEDPNARNNKGHTPLYYAHKNKVPKKIINILLAYGANPYLIMQILNKEIIDTFLAHGANGNLIKQALRQEENNQEIKKQYDYWEPLACNDHARSEIDYTSWDEYQFNEKGLNINKLGCHEKIKCIRRKYRYIPAELRNNQENAIPYEYEPENSKDRIVLIVVHGTGVSGTSGRKNPNYFDKNAAGFNGIMKFAEKYLKKYNEEHKDNPKVLHLLSFEWSGRLSDVFCRKPAGNLLLKYLETALCKDAVLAFIAHSHGCNIVNFISHLLPHQEKNDKIKEEDKDIPYKGKITTLIYFAPPCRQKKIVKKESYISYTDILGKVYTYCKNIDILGKAYDHCKEKMSNEPTNYDQLFIFHSSRDFIVKAGSIDAYSALLKIGIGGIAIKNTKDNISQEFKSADSKIKMAIIATNIGFVLYPTAKLGLMLGKAWHDHRYKNIVPINTCEEITNEYEKTEKKYIVQGPKIHIETSINGKLIGHSCTELLQYFSDAWERIIEQYPFHASCSAFLNFNMYIKEKEVTKVHRVNNVLIHEKEKVRNFKDFQCYLKKFPYDNGKEISYGYENNNASTLRDLDYCQYELKIQRIKQNNTNLSEGSGLAAERTTSDNQERSFREKNPEKTNGYCNLL